jgi:uncharacterized protein
MANREKILIDVVYALPDRQHQVSLKLPADTTAGTAVEYSRLCEKFPEIDCAHLRIGIFGRKVGPEHVLNDGQRLEIYRSLIRDPKQARRERAVRGGSADNHRS